MPKMYNLEISNEGMMPTYEGQKHYPQIHLNLSQIPSLEKYDVNDPCSLSFEGFITGKNVIKRGETEIIMVDIELRRGSVEKRD